MAGNYPDPPGSRIPYDKDGTQAFVRYTSVLSNFSGAPFDSVGSPVAESGLRAMNDEGGGSLNGGSATLSAAALIVIFPSLRDLTHILFSTNGHSQAFQWSNDTTNGVDGTWTNFTVTRQSWTRPMLRSGYSPVSLNGIKAIRVHAWASNGTTFGFVALYLLGKPTNIEGKRIMFYHPTEDSPLFNHPAHLDWGDRARESVTTKSVRVRNMSPAETAIDTVVSVETLTDATPSLSTQHELRYNGGAYGPGVTIPSLAPQEISGVIDVKQSLLSTAALSLWSPRLLAAPTSWE